MQTAEKVLPTMAIRGKKSAEFRKAVHQAGISAIQEKKLGPMCRSTRRKSRLQTARR